MFMNIIFFIKINHFVLVLMFLTGFANGFHAATFLALREFENVFSAAFEDLVVPFLTFFPPFFPLNMFPLLETTFFFVTDFFVVALFTGTPLGFLFTGRLGLSSSSADEQHVQHPHHGLRPSDSLSSS